MQVTLPPDLGARLRDYADLYAETYGVREEPADFVPFMLDAFLRGDAEFRKAMREKARRTKRAVSPTRLTGRRSHRSLRSGLGGSDGEVRELRKPPRLVGAAL